MSDTGTKNAADSRAVAGQVDRELGPLPEPDAMDEGYDFTRYSDDAMRAYAAQEVAAERERCASKAGEYARKWWTEHCRSNHHMATTRKAHDDFCALQIEIRRA